MKERRILARVREAREREREREVLRRGRGLAGGLLRPPPEIAAQAFERVVLALTPLGRFLRDQRQARRPAASGSTAALRMRMPT